MEATVVSVQPNVTKSSKAGKPYTVHVFVYQPDPYQGQAKPPTTRNVFTEDRDNPELAGKILALQPGQRITLTFVQNGQYQNLTDVMVIGGQSQPAPQQVPAQQQPQQPVTASEQAPQKDYAADREEKDAARTANINRQTALKAAVEIVKGLLAKDGFKKTIKGAILAEEVIALADTFEAYLLKLNGFADMSQEQEEPLPYEEPVYNPEDDIPF
jgi:hypothetical protein